MSWVQYPKEWQETGMQENGRQQKLHKNTNGREQNNNRTKTEQTWRQYIYIGYITSQKFLNSEICHF